MNHTYVIIAYYTDGSGFSVDFSITSKRALDITRQKSEAGQQVTVYKIINGTQILVTGKELRTSRRKQKGDK